MNSWVVVVIFFSGVFFLLAALYEEDKYEKRHYPGPGPGMREEYPTFMPMAYTTTGPSHFT